MWGKFDGIGPDQTPNHTRIELLTVICEFKYGQSWNRGDLEQIKFLLGHSSIQTTERYLGSDQEIAIAVNDNLGL